MSAPYRLFEVTGVELEYMIVGRDDLGVRSVADELIRAKCGSFESELENGQIAWSNELALHVLEFKTNGPARSLSGLAEAFGRNVKEANALLAPLGARLLPTAMHPWMDPHAEFRLWPHEYSPVYEAFHRIFDCRGHGWANLQSTHLNLPFQGDEEFGRLHAAIRVLLPILPGLAASSPVKDGRRTGLLDTRLDVYRGNAKRVPSVAGAVVPEPVFGIEAYQEQILARIYADLAALDPEGELRHEWVNARGCIARFDRNAIEIRVLDVQECPRADLAVAAAVIGAVRALCEEKLSSGADQRRAESPGLEALFQRAVRDAEAAQITDRSYLSLFDYAGSAPCSIRELWADLLGRGIAGAAGPGAAGVDLGPLETILSEGCLARRISGRLGADFGPGALREVYAELAICLEEGASFRGARDGPA